MNYEKLIQAVEDEVILDEDDFSLRSMNLKDNVVYLFYADTKLLYVGITDSFHRRYIEHYKTKEWFLASSHVQISEFLTRSEAHIYEIYYISKYNPKYNKHFSKGYLSSLELPELQFNTILLR
jgi:predicted GIY-YIG superfamily endonuclease